MQADRTQDELDELRGRMADSDFWFGEHSIPQYDLLVRDGLVTQAEADDYRSQRANMGLPMTFAELEPAPHQAFRWVKAAGGPSIGPECSYELAGLRWDARIYSEHGQLEAHEHSPDGNRDGYFSRKLTAKYNGSGVNWDATFKIADGVYARRHGHRPTFAEALAEVAAVEFKPIELSGHHWYATSANENEVPDLVAAIDGAEVEIRFISSGFMNGDRWFWERRLLEDTPAHKLAAVFNTQKLAGSAPTRDAAITDALAAPGRLLDLAGAFIGSDQFDAGRRAGIAAAQAALLHIQL